jgi:hypothetical protein
VQPGKQPLTQSHARKGTYSLNFNGKQDKKMTPQKQTPKRCTFELPTDLYDALSMAAEEHQTTAVDMLRKYIKLGLMASKPGTVVLLRDGEKEQPIMLVL